MRWIPHACRRFTMMSLVVSLMGHLLPARPRRGVRVAMCDLASSTQGAVVRAGGPAARGGGPGARQPAYPLVDGRLGHRRETQARAGGPVPRAGVGQIAGTGIEGHASRDAPAQEGRLVDA